MQANDDVIDKGVVVTASRTRWTVVCTYPDGSQVHLIMPKPKDADRLSADHLRQLATKAAHRLASVAAEDLRL